MFSHRCHVLGVLMVTRAEVTQRGGDMAAASAVVAAVSVGHVAPVATEIRPLPVAEVASLSADSSMRYGMARVDHSGRFTERGIVDALGWTVGQRLRVDVVTPVVVLRADPSGDSVVCRKVSVALPSRVRLRCGIQSGDRVLLAAAVDLGVLVVHPVAAVEAMVVRYHATLTQRDVS